MIAYALCPMNWFRRLFSSHTESAEENAVLHEEYGTEDAAQADVERFETATGGGPVAGPATSGAAQAADAELESEEAPPDLDP